MRRALVLLVTCLTWTSALLAAPTELKYLLEPPVYAEVVGRRGEEATLPCVLKSKPAHYKVKWTKLEPGAIGPENIVMISDAHAFKRHGQLGPRASLRRAHSMDASLRLADLRLQDGGTYRCELIDDIEDESVAVTLRIDGVVFPYQSQNGRYKLTFSEAKTACEEQDGVLASHHQLYRAWTEGLDWCNAGWLQNGQVQYPIITPRPACGGAEPGPGIRDYGLKDKQRDRFDAFCFTSLTTGSVFHVAGSFSFEQAQQTCARHAADLALVGQLYSAWRFHNYHRCDGGWLRDGSVRFPIAKPRGRCGGLADPGVRSFGFPPKSSHLYGAYCYQEVLRSQ
ncbi:hyaluronan and proteoglycan link protein 2-like [Entelurus aequoreus]|uniref:hyaluronan and proteoglycan link protein 2-like n=1 Tax=Entelurus aequoreus TaxID=161455 RepID=UPI002B1D5487|nr:hyaluronan and proteoglycan link protein 2-like [Entelurus aequoreus]